MLEAAGATVVHLPLIQIDDPLSWDAADEALDQLKTFDTIVFTSTNAVDQWIERGKKRGIPPALETTRIFAVGSATARRLQQHGLRVDLTPEKYSAKGLLQVLDTNLRGRRILLPRGDLAQEELPRDLRARGAEVKEAIVYRTSPAAVQSSGWVERIQRNEIDFITFASPSAVQQFVEWVGKERLETVQGHFRAASLGPTTSAALREHGFEVAVEAAPSTLAALTSALVRYYQTS